MNSRLIPIFIVNRLIINSHKRVMPDWNIGEIRGLFFKIKTRPDFNQFFSKNLEGAKQWWKKGEH